MLGLSIYICRNAFAQPTYRSATLSAVGSAGIRCARLASADLPRYAAAPDPALNIFIYMNMI
jgi:hypothetical protein